MGQHQSLRESNTSGYRGVSLYKRTGRYLAYITFRSKRCYLGYYAVPEDAACAHDAAARVLYGSTALLNDAVSDRHDAISERVRMRLREGER